MEKNECRLEFPKIPVYKGQMNTAKESEMEQPKKKQGKIKIKQNRKNAGQKIKAGILTCPFMDKIKNFYTFIFLIS